MKENNKKKGKNKCRKKSQNKSRQKNFSKGKDKRLDESLRKDPDNTPDEVQGESKDKIASENIGLVNKNNCKDGFIIIEMYTAWTYVDDMSDDSKGFWGTCNRDIDDNGNFIFTCQINVKNEKFNEIVFAKVINDKKDIYVARTEMDIKLSEMIRLILYYNLTKMKPAIKKVGVLNVNLN